MRLCIWPPRPHCQVEDRSLSAVRDCLFKIFTVTLHTWRLTQSATWQHATLWQVGRPCRGDNWQYLWERWNDRKIKKSGARKQFNSSTVPWWAVCVTLIPQAGLPGHVCNWLKTLLYC